MSSNIIFCFTGTGNSLKAAKDISNHLSDCMIVSMADDNRKYLNHSVQRIGFIFPVYYLGIPSQVRDFIENIQITHSAAYIFSIATCGRFHGNSLREVNGILERKGTRLNYGNHVQMGDNAIALYNAKGTSPQIEQRYHSQITAVIQDIKNTKQLPMKKELGLISFYHNLCIKKAVLTDMGYQISNNCISCGTCKLICPANNIELINGSPSFQHRCQQCMACIQLCPQNAINYKNKTQKRQRYHNPNISVQDLIHLQNVTVQDCD